MSHRGDVRIKNQSRCLPVSADIETYERIKDFAGAILLSIVSENVYPNQALFKTEHVDLADFRHRPVAGPGTDGEVDRRDVESADGRE